MRQIGPKNRLARRLGIDLGLKTPGTKSHARLLKKINVAPGQHGTARRRKTTEYGSQLKEKQKLRYIFGLTDGRLKRYFKEAVKKKGNTADYLASTLERRLDNIVYRLGLSPTRAAARQLISHGHVKVNDKLVNIASYEVKINDVISYANERVLKIPYIEKSLANKDILLPFWLVREGPAGKLIKAATADEINKQINLKYIIEFYSR